MVVVVHSNATENQTKPKQQTKTLKKTNHKQTSKSTKTRLEVNSWLAPSRISPLGSLMSRF